MSEYQYYEWLAIDRPLTEEEQAEVDGLSSHIDVTATGAVVTCNWGDFKHDPQKKTGVAYDEAASLLANLREIAVRGGRLPQFQARLAQLKTEYARRPALLERLRRLE